MAGNVSTKVSLGVISDEPMMKASFCMGNVDNSKTLCNLVNMSFAICIAWFLFRNAGPVGLYTVLDFESTLPYKKKIGAKNLNRNVNWRCMHQGLLLSLPLTEISLNARHSPQFIRGVSRQADIAILSQRPPKRGL